jgi:hypothetical protein
MNIKIVGKLLLFIFIVVSFYLFRHFGQVYTNNLAKTDFKNFNSSSIKGRLIEKGITHHTVSFMVDSDTKRFVFYPKINSSNESADFEYFSALGDSIIKGAFSDTLFLIKGNKLYSYTFDKDE